MSETQNTKEMKPRRKMGKTILVSQQRDSTTPVDKSNLTEEKLTGLKSISEHDGKYFLVFGDYSQAKDALIHLRKEFNYFVKFVHYKVFFKCSQLTDETPSQEFEHSTFKNAMRELVQNKTNGHVLYAPRLYRNNEKTQYVGCGNITVDTMEAQNALLNKDGPLKFSKIGEDNKYEVAFYRFRSSKGNNQSNEQNASAST